MKLQEPLFARNEVLLYRDDTCHRLIKAVYPSVVGHAKNEKEWTKGHAWLIELNQPQALPYRATFDELKKAYRRQAAQKPENLGIEQDALSTPLTRKSATTAQIAVAEAAWARIDSLVTSSTASAQFADERLFFPTSRNKLLKEHAKFAGCTPKTLLKDLRRYWQGGQTFDALLAHYDNCGRSTKDGTNNRGRPSKRGHRAYQVLLVDEERMLKALKKYYLIKDKHLTLTKTHEKLIQDNYTYLDGNGVVHLLPSSECPSLRQLDYYLKKHFPRHVVLKLRKGEKRFAQEDRAKDGSIQRECHGAGHIYEFDATIVDVLLVSCKDRTVIVGKPTMYLIIDRESRLIVGFYIGFENACYSAAMQAILSIAEDKQSLCRRLNLPYSTDDWVADGVLPEMFLADQGELIHKNARRIAMSIRATLSNVPGMRPEWKPLVECGFSMLHQVIAPDTPGYQPDAETRQRRSRNVDKEASLTLFEFTQVMARAIILHNKSTQPDYPLTLEHVNDGVKPIPREIWNHSIRRRIGLLDKADYDKLRHELLARDRATITEEGVVFKNVVYSCSEAKSRGWFVDGRKRRARIEVAFDFRLVDRILIFSPDGSGRSFVASLSKDSTKFSGLSFIEVAQHFHRANALVHQSIEETRDSKFEYRQSTKTIIDDAVEQTKTATKGISRTSRKADTKDARLSERKIEREMTAQVVHLEKQQVSSQATGHASNVTLLRPKRQSSAASDTSAASSALVQPVPEAGQVHLSPSTQDLIAAKRLLLLS